MELKINVKSWGFGGGCIWWKQRWFAKLKRQGKISEMAWV